VSAGLLAPLANPVYRWLWASSMVSNFGTLMQGVGLAWLMTSLTTSPVLIAMVPFAALAPVFLFGMVGGALADAVDRRKWLLGTQCAMLLSALAMGLFAASGAATPAAMLALAFCLGTASALNIPAWQAIVQELVPPAQVASAVSLNSMSFNTARMLGPVAGGITVGAWGPAPVFFFNAASYLAVIWALARWKGSGPPAVHTGILSGIVPGVREGVLYLARAAHLRGPLLRAASISFCAASVMALLPAIARDRLGLSASTFGILLGVFGAGALCGGGSVPWMRRRVAAGRIVAAGSFAVAAALAAVAAVPTAGWIGAALFLLGASWIACMVNLNVSVQTSVDPAFRGRAMALYFTIFQGSFALGSLAAGFVASGFGFSGSLAVFSLLLVAASLALARFPIPEPGPAGLLHIES